jgi:hypothetical protein
MENQDRERMKQEMLGQSKIRFFQYWKQREEISKWRIWENFQTQDRTLDAQ